MKELTFHRNNKQPAFRLGSMGKATTTICLAIICHGSIAQSSTELLEKSGMKKLLPAIKYIPASTFLSLSHTGSDSVSFYQPRVSSVPGFYMSETEVTNKEYNEFVLYVRDSLAHRLLGHFNDGSNLNWKMRIDWNDTRLAPLLLSAEESAYGRREIDTRKIVYEVIFNGEKEIIPVYPDTLVWMSDFSYSYNEPLAKKYFSYPDYDNFPVVGVSLKQAMAFCQWKTGQLNKAAGTGTAQAYKVLVRLPTNAEWESAAGGGKDSLEIVAYNRKSNWNTGPVIDQNGLELKKNKDDGYFYCSPVKTYPAGSYGLYDMIGNVAEWTSTCQEEVISAEMKTTKRKTYFVTKGGGWNSTPFYTQPGVCQFFRATDSHSFIGFRYLIYILKKT